MQICKKDRAKKSLQFVYKVFEIKMNKYKISFPMLLSADKMRFKK